MFQVVDLVVGSGKSCVKGALIVAHYVGTLDDGVVFDSSYSRGRPFECVIGTGRVIKGWDIGVLGSEIGGQLLDKWGINLDLPAFEPMKVGGKRTLFVPAYLAYGERTMGKIPPDSDLKFEIELLEVRTRDD